MTQNTNQNKFKKGETVFAKVKGHSAWPAVIENIDLSSKLPKYNVTFYGTQETATVKELDISVFNENKSRFGSLKNKIFKKALKEAELSINKNVQPNKSNISQNNSKIEMNCSTAGITPSAASSPLAPKVSDTDNLVTVKPDSDIENISLAEKNQTLFRCRSDMSTLHTVEKINTQEETTQTDGRTNFCIGLLNNEWVCDDTISLYLGLVNTKLTKSDTFFISPVVSQAIKTEHDYDCFVEPLDLKNKTNIFIPVSDAEPTLEVSGSHWSLLFYYNKDNCFYYFDSIGHHSVDSAKTIALKISKSITKDGHFSFKIVECPKQDNSSDCGIYLLLMVDWLVAGIMKNANMTNWINDCSVKLHISRSDCILKRASLAYLWMNRSSLSLTASVFKKLMLQDNHNQTNVNSCNEKNHQTSSTGSSNPNKNISTQNGWENVQGRSLNHKISNWAVKHPIYSDKVIHSNRFELLDQLNEKTDRPSQNVPMPTKKTNPNKALYNKNKSKTKNNRDKIQKGENLAVNLYSDSQGRGVAQLIHENSLGNVKVNSLVMPNATAQQVMDHAQKEKNGTCIILAGTNDLLRNNTNYIYKDLEEDLKKLSKENTVLLTTVPHRYDIHNKHSQIDEITILNNYILELVARVDNVHLIDLDNLKRFHYTRQGLHLNYKGKRQLSFMIIHTLKGIKKEPVNTQKNIEWRNKKSNITVVDGDMRKFILKHQYNEDTAFSHCISSDIHMGAGVAVVFKQHFGKPNSKDFLQDSLAFQQVCGGAGVYSLITKPTYYSKPSIPDYNDAFEELTKDFQKKKFKSLICSPMGCIRDKIFPKHFISNIVKFQQSTQALVTIVLFNEKSHHNLRRGMTHEALLKELQDNISISQDHSQEECHTNKHVTHRQCPTVAQSSAMPAQPKADPAPSSSASGLNSKLSGSVSENGHYSEISDTARESVIGGTGNNSDNNSHVMNPLVSSLNLLGITQSIIR